MRLIIMMDILGPLETEGWELEKIYIWEISKEPGESSIKKLREKERPDGALTTRFRN